MSKPIYTDNGVIDTNMEMVDAIISEMLENLDHLVQIKNGLLEGSQGDGMAEFAVKAKELETRLDNYRDAITRLKGSTQEAKQLIANADADVARLFAGMV
jgi:uncharacterized protein YukE